MADRTLILTWGAVVRGREERSLETFNEVVGFYGRMQQEGRIERFEVTLLAPNATLNGFMQLHGTAEQLAAVREEPDFQRLLSEAMLIVEDLCMIDGYVNEGVSGQMALFQQAIAKVPQAV